MTILVFSKNTYLKTAVGICLEQIPSSRSISLVETSSYMNLRELINEMVGAGVSDECEICLIGGRDIIGKFLSPLRPLPRNLSCGSFVRILNVRRFITFSELKSYIDKNYGFSRLTDKQRLCARMLIIFGDVAIAAKHSNLPLKTFYSTLQRVADHFNLRGVKEVKIFLSYRINNEI